MKAANHSEPLTSSPDDGLASRRVALLLLHSIIGEKKSLEQAVENTPALASLTPQNRAFASRLSKTTLRHLGQIDALIAHFLNNPLPADAVPVTQVLRLGMAEILFVKTPVHACVNCAVELVKETRFAGFSGLTNALLKRASVEAETVMTGQDSFALTLPLWLRERLIAVYGEDKARAIHQAQLAEAPLDLSCKSNPALLAEKLGAVHLPTGTVRLMQSAALESLYGFTQGEWWVQDAAAAIPVLLLGDVEGRGVLDICAAPGGKTAQIAARGAQVTALDRSHNRLQRVYENLRRLELVADVIAADATEWEPEESFSHILLDAPCSATGTLRRNPDVALHRGPEDIAKLTALQEKLLDKAFEWLEPGGTLVYAVCSLLPEEGEAQIERLLARHANAKLLPVKPAEIGNMAELITGQGMFRSLPCHLPDKGGTDGFFAARITKESHDTNQTQEP